MLPIILAALKASVSSGFGVFLFGSARLWKRAPPGGDMEAGVSLAGLALASDSWDTGLWASYGIVKVLRCLEA